MVSAPRIVPIWDIISRSAASSAKPTLALARSTDPGQSGTDDEDIDLGGRQYGSHVGNDSFGVVDQVVLLRALSDLPRLATSSSIFGRIVGTCASMARSPTREVMTALNQEAAPTHRGT